MRSLFVVHDKSQLYLIKMIVRFWFKEMEKLILSLIKLNNLLYVTPSDLGLNSTP